MNQLIPNNPAGNDLATALELGWLDLNPFEQHLSDAVGTEEPRDFYRFSLQSASQVTLSLDGLSDNANLFLTDGMGRIIVSSTNLGSDAELIDRSLDAGTYYVLVRAAAQVNNPATSYDLTLSARFTVNDQIVSDPAISLPDPEFDQIGYQVTWQDLSHNLWVAPIDRQSGDLLMEQAIIIETGLAPFGKIRNGPEWVYSQDGSQIVYTKLVDNGTGEFEPADLFLGRAWWTGTEWQTELMPTDQPLPQGNNGLAPIGSKDPNDDSPRIFYPTGSPLTIAWRDISSSRGGIVSSRTNFSGRFVEGINDSLVYGETVDGYKQIFLFDIDTNTSTQLTFEPVNYDEPSMWNAPEFNNDRVLLAGQKPDSAITTWITQLDIYRETNGTWEKIHAIQPPNPNQPLINSPESFVYNGKSYVLFTTVFNQGDKQGAQVWIAGIDPAENFYRLVSDNANISRSDPEVLITEAGAFIYYTEITPNGTRITHKADTGLGLPVIQGEEILGTTGADTLVGTPHDDRLIGGLGPDTLTGGGGSDLFIYQNAQEGRDTITDFEVGQDKIDLTQVLESVGYQGNSPFQDGYLQIFNSSSAGGGASIRVDPDGNAGAAPFSPLILVAGVDAATLLNQNSLLL